jgi:acyl dehydratase
MSDLHFDDIQIGEGTSAGPYALTKEEIIAFATQYDPRSFHIDEAAAKASVFGGLTASSAHTFAIAQALAFRWQPPLAILAALGIDEMRLPAPARPGDELSLTSTLIEKSESSKPDRGVAKFQTVVQNQRGETVLAYKITVLLARRV